MPPRTHSLPHVSCLRQQPGWSLDEQLELSQQCLRTTQAHRGSIFGLSRLMLHGGALQWEAQQEDDTFSPSAQHTLLLGDKEVVGAAYSQ